MNRDIKFRGRVIDKKSEYYNKFVVGYYVFKPKGANDYDDRHYIYIPHIQSLGTTLDKEEIDINTLGQYTGLTDKNGVEIYEGDNVIHTSFPRDEQVVVFRDGAFYVKDMLLNTYHSSVIKVIGNIHE